MSTARHTLPHPLARLYCNVLAGLLLELSQPCSQPFWHMVDALLLGDGDIVWAISIIYLTHSFVCAGIPITNECQILQPMSHGTWLEPHQILCLHGTGIAMEIAMTYVPVLCLIAFAWRAIIGDDHYLYDYSSLDLYDERDAYEGLISVCHPGAVIRRHLLPRSLLHLALHGIFPCNSVSLISGPSA